MHDAGPVGGDPDPVSVLSPAPGATALAEYLLDADDLHDQLLSETIAAAESGRLVEAGRTICTSGGDDPTGFEVLEPLARRPRSVQLSRCRRGRTGIMHTHVTQSQLQNSSHSLPDFANVVFGNVTASCVVGFQTSQVAIEPVNAEPAGEAFREAVGAPVYSTRDVVHALETGGISNPAAARARVEERLDPLIRSRSTPNTEWADELLSPIIPAGALRSATVESPATCAHGCLGHRAPSHLPSPGAESDVGRMREQTRELRNLLHDTTRGVSMRRVAVNSVVTSVLSSVLNQLMSD